MSVQDLNAARDALITPVDPAATADAQVAGLQHQVSQLAAIGVLLTSPTDGGDVREAMVGLKALAEKTNMKLAAAEAVAAEKKARR